MAREEVDLVTVMYCQVDDFFVNVSAVVVSGSRGDGDCDCGCDGDVRDDTKTVW